MPKRSAGLLLHRRRAGQLEVFLVHPGGPFFARRDAGVWSIPKGEIGPDEDPLAAARREVEEETGQVVAGPFLDLGTIRQAGGKEVRAFAAPADFPAESIVSNPVMIEWPPRSGRRQTFPEVDRGGWFDPVEAAARLVPAQRDLVRRLELSLAAGAG